MVLGVCIEAFCTISHIPLRSTCPCIEATHWDILAYRPGGDDGDAAVTALRHGLRMRRVVTRARMHLGLGSSEVRSKRHEDEHDACGNQV